MWRPGDWPDILRNKTEEWNANPPEWTFDNFIEFGADAMLEALKNKEDAEYWKKEWEEICLNPSTDGWLVFIPDEQ